MVAVARVGKEREEVSMATIAQLGALSSQASGIFCFMGEGMKILSVPSKSRKS